MRRWKAVLPWAAPAIALAALPVLIGAALAPAACAGTTGAVAPTASPPTGAVTLPRITIPPLHQPQPLLGEPHSILGTRTQSPNWSGYDVVTGGPFTSVTATWRQPRVRASTYFTDVAFWVGLDGDTADPRHARRSSRSAPRATVFRATSTTTPGMRCIRPLRLSHRQEQQAGHASRRQRHGQRDLRPAGDTPASFTLSLVNHTTGKSFTYTETVDKRASNPNAPRSRWSPKRPHCPTGTSCRSPTSASSASAAAPSNGQPIGAFDWSRIDMVSGDTGATEVATSPLIPDGTGFSVTTDLTRPVTTVSGAGAAWHGKPVTLRFRATDNRGGTGVAYTQYSLDGGATWTKGDVGHASRPRPTTPATARPTVLVPLGRQGRQPRDDAALHGAHRHPRGPRRWPRGPPRRSAAIGRRSLLCQRPAARESHGAVTMRFREAGGALAKKVVLAGSAGRHDHHLRLRLSPGGRGVYQVVVSATDAAGNPQTAAATTGLRVR